MSSRWVVPAAPRSSGPAGLSSVYLFNGLEDGGGVHGAASLILQPVLQYGKSGCVLDPLLWHRWHFAAYYVSGDGRAHCGRVLPVEEGDLLEGAMSLGPGGVWSVEARVVGGSSSVLKAEIGVGLDAAYLTMEAMILYSCGAYPSSDNVTFTNNELSASERESIRWTPVVRHKECGQSVALDGGSGAVTLKWSSSS